MNMVSTYSLYCENDGVFNENDYFEFYGDKHKGDSGYQDDYTAENVYTLTWLITMEQEWL